MGGSMSLRPPGGGGVARPERGADGRGGGGGVAGPDGAGAGGDGADVAAVVPGGGSVVPDGGSVAAGAVWGALVAARDDEALSVSALARRAGASVAEAARALERFEAAELVLRVPRGRRAGVGWMVAGGVRQGLGITQTAAAPGGYGHGPALLDALNSATGAPAPVAEADLPLLPRPGALLKPPRLAKGELEARVLATLRERHPEEFGPLGLSRQIGGYSSGAVANALERLCKRGQVLLTCQAPKRYAALPPEAADGGQEHAA